MAPPQVDGRTDICESAPATVFVAGKDSLAEQIHEALRLVLKGHVASAEAHFRLPWNSHGRDFQLAFAVDSVLDSMGAHHPATGWGPAAEGCYGRNHR